MEPIARNRRASFDDAFLWRGRSSLGGFARWFRVYCWLPPQRPRRQTQLALHRLHRLIDGAVLEARVHLAILAAAVLPALPVGPIRLRPEIFPLLEIAFSLDQV